MAGGKRTGSGRPSGSTMTNRYGNEQVINLIPPDQRRPTIATPVVLDKNIPDTQQHLIGLQAGVATALRMMARAKNITEITEALGLSKTTLLAYKDRFPLALQEASIEAASGPDELLRPLLPKVMFVYDDLLDRTDRPDVQSGIARDVMDRLFGKPVVRTQVESVQPVSVEFIDIPATILNDQEEVR